MNPNHYLTPYSTYNTTEEGLKIEALFRKVGTPVWYPAFSTAIEKVVPLDIKKDEPAPVKYNDVIFESFFILSAAHMRMSTG